MSKKQATSRRYKMRLQTCRLRLQCLKLALEITDRGYLRANIYAHRRDPSLLPNPLLTEEVVADMLLRYVITGTMMEELGPATAFKPVEMTPEEQAAYERPVTAPAGLEQGR